jgi:hypothetical protein
VWFFRRARGSARGEIGTAAGARKGYVRFFNLNTVRFAEDFAPGTTTAAGIGIRVGGAVEALFGHCCIVLCVVLVVVYWGWKMSGWLLTVGRFRLKLRPS